MPTIFTPAFVISQIFTIISYILLIATYNFKNRRQILIFNFASLVALGLTYIFLSAWSGLAMIGVALIRNIIFLIQNKNPRSKKISTIDIVILVILLLITFILAIFTYEGPFSMLAVLASALYTLSVWQKDVKTYKLLGVPVGIFMVSYKIYVQSPFGIILEAALLVFILIGIFREYKKPKSLTSSLRRK